MEGTTDLIPHRYLILDPPSEYKEQPCADTPTSTPTSCGVDGDQFMTDNEKKTFPNQEDKEIRK
jgi:hypothetical protein